MKEKILVVEDDTSILTGLVDLLQGENYRIVSAQDGKRALELYAQDKPHLVLLDIMIPEKSGYDVCKEIRKIDPYTPIVMLTAKQQEVDKVIGLELGADDYIVKPFGVNELLARVRAVLRRAKIKTAGKRDDSPIAFGDVTIDCKTMRGQKKKRRFSATRREIDLLRLFVQHKGEVLDRFTLLEKVWGIKYEGTTRTLDQHIVTLRQKIEDNSSDPQYIITVHGVGYRFCDP